MGLGNTGTKLERDSSKLHLYTSRDAGQIWSTTPLPDGSYDFDIGDHGAVMAAVPNGPSGTSVMYYSMNEGKSFDEFGLSETPVSVEWIETEPGTVSSHVLVVGKGKLVHVDFSLYFDRRCGDGDMEMWNPSGTAHGKCLMGRTVTYSRRRQDASCFLGPDYTQIVTHEACVCTAADFECDFGWTYDPHEGCVADDENETDRLKEEKRVFLESCEAGQSYNMSLGYRKVPGDVCAGGVDPRFVQVHCRNSAMGGSPALAIGLLGGVFFVVSMACVLMARRSKEFRRFALNIWHSLPGLVGLRRNVPVYRQIRMPDEDPLGVGGLTGLDFDLEDFGGETAIELREEDIPMVQSTTRPGQVRARAPHVL